MKPSEIREGSVYARQHLRRRVLRVFRQHPSADFDVKYETWNTLKPASRSGPHECYRNTFAAWAEREIDEADR